MDKSQSTASSLEESLGDDTTRRLSSAAIMVRVFDVMGVCDMY